MFSFGNTVGSHGAPCPTPKLVETQFGKRQVKQVSAGLYQTWATSANGECHLWKEGTSMSADLRALATKEKCVQVSCGQTYSALLFESGVGKVYNSGHLTSLPPVLETEDESSVVIKQVACADDHILALLEDGRVCMCSSMPGARESDWRLLDFGGKSVASIAVGQMYSAAVTTDGGLWTFGIGPLGHAISVKQDPEQVEALRGKKVVAVACGSFHMGCVTESGELYTWGSSVWHQLGHGERKNVVEPRRVTALEGKRVVEVSCGAYHTAVRTDAGRVYTFGAGSLGALGHGDLVDQEIPRLVDSLVNRCVQHVSCGWYHTTVVVGMDPNISLLRDEMGKLLHEQSDFFDIDVYCGQEPAKPPIRAHKVVLAARCPKLAEVLAADPGKQELYISGMDSATLAEFLHFLYTDTTRQGLDVDMLLNLLSVGVAYNSALLQKRCVELFQDELSLDNVLAHWRKVLDKPEPWVLDYRQMLHNAVVGFILREDNLQLLATKDVEALQAMMPHDPRLTSAAEAQLVRRPDGQLLVDRPLSSSRGALRASQQRIRPDEVIEEEVATEEELEEEKKKEEKEGEAKEAKKESEESEAAENKEEQQHEVVESLKTTDTQEEVVEAKAEATEAEPRARSQCETEEIARWEAETANEEKVAQETSTTADDATERDTETKEEEETTTTETEQERNTGSSGSEASTSAPPSVEKSNQEEIKVEVVVVEEEEPEEPTTYTFHTDLQRFVKCSQFADVTFAVEGELIPAHKAILCGRSEHFRAMFTSGMRESQAEVIDVHDITLPAFNALLNYLYSGVVEITEDNVVELLMISNQYTLTHLQEQCECYVEKGIYKDNAAYILEMAHRYQTHHLRTIAMNYMLQQRDHVMRTEGFQELSDELLQEFKSNVACAKNCKATGTGASKGYEGETAFFKIEAFDEFGNKCARGGENFKVQILEETPAERAVRKRREAEAKRKVAEAQKTTATTCTVTPDTAAPGDTTTTAAVEETSDTAAAQAGEYKSGAEEKEATKEKLEAEEEKEKKNEGEEEEVEEEGVDSEKEEEDYRNRKPIVDAEAGEEEQQHETQWLAYHDDEFWVCEECTLLNSKTLTCAVCDAARPVVTNSGSSKWIRAVHLLGNNDGSYLVSYVALRSGRYSLHIKLGDEPIAGSPYFLRVEPAYAASQCTADGEGLRRVEIDNETTFTIQARDMFGRPIRAGSKWFVVRLSHQEESANSHMDWKADKGMVTDNNDGTYTARYTQRQVGKFYVSVLLGHMHISGSPFTVRAVSTVAHAANCVAFGDGLERAVIGRPAAFTIQAKDRQDNPLDKGGDKFVIVITRTTDQGSADDVNGDNDNDDDVRSLLASLPVGGPPPAPAKARPTRAVAVQDSSAFAGGLGQLRHKLADDEQAAPMVDDGAGDAAAGATATPASAQLPRTFRRAQRRNRDALSPSPQPADEGGDGSTSPEENEKENEKEKELEEHPHTKTKRESKESEEDSEEGSEEEGEEEKEGRRKRNLLDVDSNATTVASTRRPLPPPAVIQSRISKAAEASQREFNITVEDQGVGVYLVHYTVKEASDSYRIHILHNNQHILGSPFALANVTEAPQPTSQQLGQTEPQSTSFLAFIEAEAGGGRPASRKGRGPRRPGSKSSTTTTTTTPLAADLDTPAAAADASGEEKGDSGWDVTPHRSEGEEVKTEAEAETEAPVVDEGQVAAPLGFTVCWESTAVSTFETTDTSSPFFRPSFTFTPAASDPASTDATPTTTEGTALFSPSPSASPSPTPASPFGSPFSSPASTSPFTGFSPFSAASTSSLTPSLTTTTATTSPSSGLSPVAKARAAGKRSAATRTKAKPAAASPPSRIEF